jgi:hypothetical protein
MRLLALCGLWRTLFFGRETWGVVVILAGVPADLLMHRLEDVFDLSAVLLAALGLTRMVELAAARSRVLGWAGGAAIAAAVLYIGVDRSEYLAKNRIWGENAANPAAGGERPKCRAPAYTLMGRATSSS